MRAQFSWLEYMTYIHGVVGSNPTVRTMYGYKWKYI